MIRGRTSPLSNKANKVLILPSSSKGKSSDTNELKLSHHSRLKKKNLDIADVPLQTVTGGVNSLPHYLSTWIYLWLF